MLKKTEYPTLLCFKSFKKDLAIQKYMLYNIILEHFSSKHLEHI